MFSGLIFSLETNLGVKQKKDVKALVEANGGKISDFVNTKVGSLFHYYLLSSLLRSTCSHHPLISSHIHYNRSLIQLIIDKLLGE